MKHDKDLCYCAACARKALVIVDHGFERWTTVTEETKERARAVARTEDVEVLKLIAIGMIRTMLDLTEDLVARQEGEELDATNMN
jgi:uncharacterized protein related to proFAR isomerase